MGTGILSKLAPEQKGDIMSFSRKRSFRSFVFIGTELFVLVLLCLCLFMKRTDRQAGIFQTSGDFIKWVDFNVPVKRWSRRSGTMWVPARQRFI